MPNPFDQFDVPGMTATATANPFDQFDQFDTAPQADPRAARRADLQAQQAAARSAGETTSFAARAAAGIEQGLRTPEVMVRGGLDALQYYRALDAVTGSGNRFQSQNEAELRAMRDRDAYLARETQAIEGRDGRNFVGDLVQGVARGVVELPPQLMAGAAGAMRGAAVQASAAMGGLQGGLSQYAQDRGEGRSQLEALPPAVASGLITAVTTRAFGDTGIESVFRNEGVQGFRRRLLGVLKDAGMEGAEEFVDQAQQDLLERATRNPGKTLGESFYDTMQALGVGTVIGGAATAPRLIQRANRPVIVNEQTGTTEFPPLEGDELPPPPPPAPPAGPANVAPPIRGEAAMQTRPSAGWTPDGPRTPAVDPELAAAIAAIRAGYNPEVDAPAPAPAPPSTFNLQPSTFPEAPGVPPPLEGQPYQPGLLQRPEAAMETRRAAPLDLQREPAVSPELADAIAAVRAGYNPEVDASNTALQAASAIEVRPPSDNVTEVMEANGKDAGAKLETVDANTLVGTLDMGQPKERQRVAALKAKISGEGGYIARLIVDAAGNVIEGQHRLEALRQLGITKIPVVRIFGADDFIPDVDRVKKAIRDNGVRSSDQVNQLVRRLGEVLMDEEGSVEELKQWEAPLPSLGAAWTAAISEIERQRVTAPTQPVAPTPAPPAAQPTPPDQSGGPTELTPPAKAKASKATAPKPAAAEERPPGLDPLIQVGKQVMVMRSTKSRKLAKAKVHRITPDGITVYYYKDKTFETVPPLKVQPTNAAAGVAAYHAQFQGLSAAERKAAKAGARAFKDLIRNEGWRFGWYDPRVEMGATESKSQGILADEAFDRGLQKALAELRVEPDPDTPDVQLAKLLPRLRDYIEQNTPLAERQNLAWMQATAQPDANDVPVYGNALAIGQTLEVDGEPVKVTAIDSDTGMVTLEDGTKFGTQQLEDDALIYVDKVNPPPAREAVRDDWDQPAANDFALNAPESVEEQKARIAQEQAQRDAQAQRAKLAELQAKPLQGTTGDLGQGSLIDAPQDLFAPPSAVDSAIAALEAAKIKPGGLYSLPDLGLTVTLWNGTLTAAQVALRAGRTLAQAVQAGVDWLRAQGQQFDEAKVRAALEQALPPELAGRANALKQMANPGVSPRAKEFIAPQVPYTRESRAEWQRAAQSWMATFDNPQWAAAEYWQMRDRLPGPVWVALGLNIAQQLNALETAARAAGRTAEADALGTLNGDFRANFVQVSTDVARTLNAYGMMSVVEEMGPFAADVFAQRTIEQASQKQKQRIKPVLDKGPDGEPGLTDRLNEINRAGIEEAARTPEVQGTARTVINQTIEEEAERKDTAVQKAITLEVSNTLETLPSVVRKANAAVLGAWDKLAAGEQVRQQAGRAGQALENSLWSAIKQRGGAISTVSSVIAQVNRALHEQVNRTLGVTPQQFVNPTTYLMRLRDALGNAEVMSRIWEQTRAAVGNNLAAIDEMERLLVRIQTEIAELEAEAKTPLAGGPEVTAKDAKLKAQQQAARDEMLKGRNAAIAEAIKQRRDRIADVTAQLAEYRKMQPAWQAVMGMTVDVWGPNLLRGLLREQMKADGFRLRKAVADHYRGLAGAPDPLQSLGALRDKIIAASGLDPQAAERLAKDLDAEFTAQVNQERARLAERLAKARERAKAKAAEREANQPLRDAEALIDGYERRQTEWLKPAGRKSAVRAIVRQALREGAAVAGLNEQVVRGGVQAQLEAVGVPREAAYRLAYEVWQDRQAKGGGIDAVVAARVKQLQLDLGRVIRQHWTQVDKAGESLAEHIVGETQMPAEQAERLAAAIQRRFKALVQARKEKALRNLAKTPGARELQKPTVAQRIIEATNLGALDSEGLWQAVAEKLGLPTYTAEASAEVKRLADRAQQLPEGSVQRRKATADMMNYIARRKGVKRGDLAWAFWYGNVLSDPRTWGVNFGDTGLNALASTAAVFTTEPGGVPQAIRQVPRAVGKGMAEAREVWRTGQDLRTHKEGDLSAPVLALYDRKAGFGPMMAWLYSNVGKVMTATDVFWQQATREMKAVQLARIMAKEEGLTGNALRLRVEEILNNTTERRGQLEAQLQREAAQMRAAGMEPDALWEQRRLYQLEEELRGPELEARANDFAARTAYNNEPYGVMGAVTNAIELGTRAMEAQAEKTGNERTAALASLARRFVIPFTRIPANAWNERLNYTPLGLARGTWAVLRARVMPDGQQRLYGREVQPGDVAEVLVKGAGGTLAMATLVLAGLKALDDDEGWQIHGAGPRNSDHRKTLRGTGWIPFSFQVGDKFVSFANTPFAAAFAMVGNYVDRHRYKDTDADGALNEARLAAMGAVQVFEQQTYIDAVSRTLGLLDNVNDKTPVRMAEVLGRGGASFVPVAGANVLRGVDRANDPKVYQAKTEADALLFGFPFVRRIGQPALNEFGEPVTLYPMARFYTTRKEDVLVDLVRRGIYPPKPNKAVNRSGREMTDDEHYRYVQESGQAIKRRLETPGMRQMIRSGKEEDARKAVTAIVREERERARRRLGF